MASLIAIGCVVMLAFPLSQRSVFMEYDLARLGKAALLGSVTVAASIAGSWAGLPRLALCAFLWFFFLAAALWLDVVRLSVYREMLQAAVPRGQGTDAE